ncbi:MAG: hypothetical protein HGB02_00190 [Chlorobiaceae bacterium]|nr:hypothetical protein [Chlorobiaceae bacterium]
MQLILISLSIDHLLINCNNHARLDITLFIKDLKHHRHRHHGLRNQHWNQNETAVPYQLNTGHRDLLP